MMDISIKGNKLIMKVKPIILQVALFAILSILAGACSTSTSTTEPPTQISSVPMEVSPTTETDDAGPDEIQKIPDKPLSDEGPWWVFSTTNGFFAINPDGSGLTQFYHGPIYSPHIYRILTAPRNGHIAYLTGNDLYNTTLRVNEFPGHTLIVEMPLTSDQSEPGSDSMPGDPEVEAVRAMIHAPSMAFSPDGRYLAFMGAIEGPTSDLYLFSLENYETTRLTEGTSQAYQPVWSPDGKYIVHTGVRTFGTGAGYSMTGIWAAQTDVSGVVTLYDPSGSGSEEIIGWVDDQTFVVHSWDPVCGPNYLRTFNIETKESNEVWSESFRSVAFDPSNAVAVLSSNVEECSPEGGVGIYLVPTDGRAPLRILEDTGPQVMWSPGANLFLASTEYGILAIDSNGQFINLDSPPGADPFPAVAPVSKDLAWSGNSLWIGPLLGSIDHPPQEIFNEPVYTVAWDQNGQSVTFFADSGLYVAQQPDYKPLLVAEGLDNRNGYSGWVMP
jgi:hypothetical protein